jgi:hypothetical protein
MTAIQGFSKNLLLSRIAVLIMLVAAAQYFVIPSLNNSYPEGPVSAKTTLGFVFVMVIGAPVVIMMGRLRRIKANDEDSGFMSDAPPQEETPPAQEQKGPIVQSIPQNHQKFVYVEGVQYYKAIIPIDHLVITGGEVMKVEPFTNQTVT